MKYHYRENFQCSCSVVELTIYLQTHFHFIETFQKYIKVIIFGNANDVLLLLLFSFEV